MVKKLIVCAGILGVLSGCVNTPPGQLTDDAFNRTSISVDGSQSEVYARFRAALRQCGPTSKGIVFVTQYGVPDCMTTVSGSEQCDLYAGGMAGGQSNFVLGRADFTQAGIGKTNVDLRVRKLAAGGDAIVTAWSKFAQGRADEVCSQ